MNRLFDICLSSCSMMSDSCSDIFACLKEASILAQMCVTHLINLKGGGGGGALGPLAPPPGSNPGDGG